MKKPRVYLSVNDSWDIWQHYRIANPKSTRDSMLHYWRNRQVDLKFNYRTLCYSVPHHQATFFLLSL